MLQVKENFGGSRIHVNHAYDASRQRIETAMQEFFHACEVCGQPGRLREDARIKTFCDEHASARGKGRWLSHSDEQDH